MKLKLEDVSTSHTHTVNVNLPTQDLDGLIDKVVDGAVTIIVVFTAAQVVKSVLTK